MAESKSKFSFLKSKKFWLTVVHVGIIGAGLGASIATGNPLPSAAAGAINALIKSPLTSDTVSPSEVNSAVSSVETIVKAIK